MRLFRLLFLLGAACCMVALGACSPPSPSSPALAAGEARLPDTHPSWNGLRVTSARQGDKLPNIGMKAMNMLVWEFDAELPDPQQFVNCVVQAHSEGKTTSIGGLGVGMPPGEQGKDPRKHVTVVLFPLGDSWLAAAKLRCIMSIDQGASSTECENPFRGAKMMANGGEPILLPDGSFRLLWGSKTDRMVASDPDIAVTVALSVKDVKPVLK